MFVAGICPLIFPVNVLTNNLSNTSIPINKLALSLVCHFSNDLPNIFPLKTYTVADFPGGTVDRNLPANEGDMDPIPGLGRFHMPQSN